MNAIPGPVVDALRGPRPGEAEPVPEPEPEPDDIGPSEPEVEPPSWSAILRRLAADHGLEVIGVVAMVVAARAAASVDLRTVGDTGLASALPITYWAAFVTLNAAFLGALAWGRGTRTHVILLGCLVVTTCGVASFASSIPRIEAAWRHLGVADELIRSGGVDPRIDAYFNWPGFFSLVAFGLKAAGVHSPLGLARWAPVWNTALWLLAASLPLRALVPDPRRRWLALWIFCLGNWIDQDYFSPQAFAFFLYVVIIGLALWALPSEPVGRLREHLAAARAAGSVSAIPARWSGRGLHAWWLSRRPVGETPAADRGAALIIIVGLAAAIIVSHQLTPVALIVSVVALVLSGRCWSTRLPTILGILLLAWLATGASRYLAGHPVVSLSQVEESANENVVQRLGGTPGHRIVVRARMALLVGMLGVAVLGAVRWRKSGVWVRPVVLDVAPVALALAPFIMVPAQSYGGEMLLRAALFSLPFTALLIAGTLLPSGTEWRLKGVRAVLILVICSGIGAASLFAKYGNIRFDSFTPDEVAAVNELYRIGPPEGVFISIAHPTPWRNRAYADHRYTTFSEVCVAAPDAPACVDAVLGRIRHQGKPGAVLMMRSGYESTRMQGLMPPGRLEAIERGIAGAPGVRLAYENPDARLYLVEAEP